MPPDTRCTLPIVILAAGASSRMRGRDKLLEEVDGAPLLRRQAQMARRATSGTVLVTLPEPPHPRHDALAGCDVVRVAVPDAALGISASLRRGLGAVPAEADAVMILLADLPDLTEADLCRLCAAVRASPDSLIWRGATETGLPGHPIVFARPLFDELHALSGDSGGAEVVARHRDRMHLVPLPGNRARADLDTPEDWASWRAARRP